MILQWFNNKRISIELSKVELLAEYANMVYDANLSFNITGFSKKEDIIIKLIVSSLEPIIRVHVPRGTSFVDIGTGAGIPGIPIAIYFDQIHGVLIDSNSRKTDFVQYCIDTLCLKNCRAYCGRIDTYCHDMAFRSSFSYCFSRAFGDLYYTIEYGGPLLHQGGLLYVYANDSGEDIDDGMLKHALNLGLKPINKTIRSETGFSDNGLIFRKEMISEDQYPRSSAILKRELKCLKKVNR